MTTTALKYRAIQNKISYASLSSLKINWKLFCFSCILLSLLMLVFYVYSINQLTGGTLIIKNYNKEIENLTKENRTLEINFAQTDFMGRAAQRAKELSFEKTTNIKYIQILEGYLATAQNQQ